MQYIQWHDFSAFESTIQLGINNDYYNFIAQFNEYDSRWYVSIKTLDNQFLIASKKLVLRKDLFANADKTKIPLCILYPDSLQEEIQEIGYTEMVSNAVKLFHILPISE